MYIHVVIPYRPADCPADCPADQVDGLLRTRWTLSRGHPDSTDIRKATRASVSTDASLSLGYSGEDGFCGSLLVDLVLMILAVVVVILSCFYTCFYMRSHICIRGCLSECLSVHKTRSNSLSI